ncbi:hypothetical protein PSJE_09040 [Pseudomonas jessenii]|uniref:DUF3301 domain-containing protein n=2 Tax=Pseudomonas TaxID=286 RepID=A0A231GPS3_PSEJE|nr:MULTISPECIES: hypothetical protein [Pseudomonas]OXR38598.1 hypothetical protein PSJE_09040 [Pseudomonas jessenii]SEC13566.1 hypothetical protein SAMN04490187_3301 [Pseudomonas jessenii]VVP72505.1 hypothetical protein PS922_00924 [Pseudomonas fluorescens]
MRTSALVILLISYAVLMVIFFKLNARNNLRRREGLYQAFETTMRQHGIKSFEILKESIYIGNNFRPSELCRVLLDDSGHYFLYLHASNAQPTLTPLTEERALQAAQGDIGIQA